MQEIEQLLAQWRSNRNIKTFPLTIKEHMLDELREVKEAQKIRDFNNYVEEIADVAIFAFNGIGLMNKQYKRRAFQIDGTISQVESYINSIRLELFVQTYNTLSTIITLCEELVTNKRYDFKKVVLEKIKVLNSRKQNPDQIKHWELHGVSGKWEKDRSQSKDSLYVGNYEICKATL